MSDAPVPDAPVGLSTLGRCLIAAGLASSVCAVVLDERDLLRIGVFAIVLPLCAGLVAKLGRQSLTARRTLSPDRVSVGDLTHAELELVGGGLLGTRLMDRLGVRPGVRPAGRPGGRPAGRLGGVLGGLGRWLAAGRVVLTDAVPDALGRSPQLSAIPTRPGDEPDIALRYPISPLVRGVHQIGPLTVRVSDPLGMAEYERELAGRTPLTVLPRVTPLRGLPDGLGWGEGDAGSTGLRRGPGERDAVVRVYQPGDALRTVHWRSTARRDELMVRMEERPWHGGVTVLLDRRGHAHRGLGASASLEWAVELAASVCHHLIARGRRVTLVGEDGVTLATGRDPDALLDSLALLRPSAQPGLRPGVEDGGELFAVIGAVEPLALSPLVRRWSGGHAHAVLLDVAAWQGREPALGVAAPARVLTDAGWTVLIGTPARGPEDVWDEFCRRLPVQLGTGR